MLKIDESKIWKDMRNEALEASHSEPILAEMLDEVFLSKKNIFDALCCRIATKVEFYAKRKLGLLRIFKEAFEHDNSIKENVLKDIVAIRERDPACTSYITPILYFKGFQAITAYRVAHNLWQNNRKHLASLLQSLISEAFAVDIHPAAKFGGGILLDHATSFVAGETSVVDDNVSILHEVTLGGTGNEIGDKHPKIQSGVLIGAGAKLIGNITIGKCAKIGAGSVVLNDVEAHTTVAGIPARKVSTALEDDPAACMDQNFKRHR